MDKSSSDNNYGNNNDNLSFNSDDLVALKKPVKKYFSPSEKHLEDKIWPECDCMTCASNEADKKTKDD